MHLRYWKEIFQKTHSPRQSDSVRYSPAKFGCEWLIVVIREADTVIRMFAELLSQTDDLAGIYAAEADRRRVAGLACEAAYADAQGR